MLFDFDVEIGNHLYKLDYVQKTAELVDFTRKINQVTIPKKIIHESQEFNVFIQKDIFCSSPIEDITFPSDYQLEEGLFQSAEKLKRVRIVPSGDALLKNYSKKFVLGKSDKNSEVFDIFYFAPHELKKVRIPLFTETIGAFACYKCQITEIVIPSQVTQIHDNAFSSCRELKKVTFSNDSKLQIIGKEAFSYTKIESILIPSHVTLIDDYSFQFCEELKKVEFKEDSELERIGYSTFSFTKIESILIPSHVTFINSSAFYSCTNLIEIEFKEDSELQRIGSTIIGDTSISNFVMPSNVSDLNIDWCLDCNKKLISISLAPNNKHFIEDQNKIIFWKKDPEKEDFDALIWADHNIKQAFISIPSSIKKIYSSAFLSCQNIRRVEFASNSQLQILGSFAFSNTSIERISIPNHVKKICDSCFCNCKKLTRIDITNDSELEEIGMSAFSCTKIQSIILPKKVKRLGRKAFYGCYELQIIELNNNLNITNYNFGCPQIKPLINKNKFVDK